MVLDENDKEKIESTSELKVSTPSRYRRRGSALADSRVIVNSSSGNVLLLPSVLLTFNEKFMKIGSDTSEKD